MRNDNDVAHVCYEAVRAIRQIEHVKTPICLLYTMMDPVDRENFIDEVRRIRSGGEAESLTETERKVVRGIIVALTF